MKPLISFRGKCRSYLKVTCNLIVWISLEGGGKEFGFKFVLPSSFPQQPPIAYLDEQPNPLLYEIFDYIKPGNILDFGFYHDWKTDQRQNPQKYTLQNMLIQVNKLYFDDPPDISSFSEDVAPVESPSIFRTTRIYGPTTEAQIDDDSLSYIMDAIKKDESTGHKIDVSHRASIVQYSSSVSTEKAQAKLRPDIIGKLKPKGNY